MVLMRREVPLAQMAMPALKVRFPSRLGVRPRCAWPAFASAKPARRLGVANCIQVP